jgi:hypothetical protein
MINANKLFFVPAIGAFLVLIPVVGVFMWLFVIVFWYNKNNLEIHRFFRGQNYKQDEVSEDTLEESK